MPDSRHWDNAATLSDFFKWASSGADQSPRWRIVTQDGKPHEGPVRYASAEFVVIGRAITEEEKGRHSSLIRLLIPYSSISSVEFMAAE